MKNDALNQFITAAKGLRDLFEYSLGTQGYAGTDGAWEEIEAHLHAFNAALAKLAPEPVDGGGRCDVCGEIPSEDAVILEHEVTKAGVCTDCVGSIVMRLGGLFRAALAIKETPHA